MKDTKYIKDIKDIIDVEDTKVVQDIEDIKNTHGNRSKARGTGIRGLGWRRRRLGLFGKEQSQSPGSRRAAA